jgi:mersacidin/lichenicidin family type 2 lantibiotic
MTDRQIVRAWRDPEYRKQLSEADRGRLPAHPAGTIELSYDDLRVVAGGLKGKFTPACTALNTCDVCVG